MTKLKQLNLGTQTGSLINHVLSSYMDAIPEVGMGATILCWTDRHACTVTEIFSPKKIGVGRDKATPLYEGATDHQEYSYEHATKTEFIFTLRKNGRWVLKGTDYNTGQMLSVGERDEYYDFSF